MFVAFSKGKTNFTSMSIYGMLVIKAQIVQLKKQKIKRAISKWFVL
jgi:hypothetical protein